jgi:hypothetical protein
LLTYKLWNGLVISALRVELFFGARLMTEVIGSWAAISWLSPGLRGLAGCGGMTGHGIRR